MCCCILIASYCYACKKHWEDDENKKNKNKNKDGNSVVLDTNTNTNEDGEQGGGGYADKIPNPLNQKTLLQHIETENDLFTKPSNSVMKSSFPKYSQQQQQQQQQQQLPTIQYAGIIDSSAPGMNVQL
ncbi:hypothetical protein RFI_33398, partial [Reticulomyxa filosa]